MSTLNYKQRLFLNYYLGDAKSDAVKAARLAGYSDPEQYGERLLKNRRISAYLEQKLEESGALTVPELLARLSAIATLDPMEFITFDDEDRASIDLKKIKKLRKGHLIKDLKIRKSGEVEINFHSSVDAMDKLAKFHGMFKERIEIEHVNGDASTDRVLAILGGLSQLARSVNAGADGGEPQPGALCGGGEQWEVEPRPALEADQPTPDLAGSEGDRPAGDHPGSEVREVGVDLEILPGVDLGTEA